MELINNILRLLEAIFKSELSSKIFGFFKKNIVLITVLAGFAISIGLITQSIIRVERTVNSIPAELDRRDSVKKVEAKIEHDRKHDEMVKMRRSLNCVAFENIEHIGCDFLFYIEFHNGTESNIGVPFEKCDVTFQVSAKGVMTLDLNGENDKLLSRYQNIGEEIFYNLDEEVFSENVEELKSIETQLYYDIMKIPDAKHVTITKCMCKGKVGGCFVCVWTELQEDYNIDEHVKLARKMGSIMESFE